MQRFEHVGPSDHPALYCSSRLTLNLTREEMAASGYCPSGRFFEAAACGAPIVTDWFRGLDSFFEPGQELLVANDTETMFGALDHSDAELLRMARRARQRTLDEHTGNQRALTMLAAFEEARSPQPRNAQPAASQCPDGGRMIGIIPAAGAGLRIQPLGCSKELLPVGSRVPLTASSDPKPFQST